MHNAADCDDDPVVVSHLVCMSVTRLRCAKTTERIVVLFGMNWELGIYGILYRGSRLLGAHYSEGRVVVENRAQNKV